MHRRATAALLSALAATACADDDPPAAVDAPWSAEVVHAEGNCTLPSRCERTLRVTSDGALTVTDDLGTLDLAPVASADLYAAWADTARTMSPSDCSEQTLTDIADSLSIHATYGNEQRTVDGQAAMGCLRYFTSDSALAALIERSFELVDDVYDCEPWTAHSEPFGPLEVDDETERYACR